MSWTPATFRGTRVFAPEFLGELARALILAPRAFGALGWSYLLLPPLVAPELGLPDDALVAYQRLEWSAPITPGTAELEATVEWCSAGRLTEFGVAGRAWRDGQCVARSLLALRLRCGAESWGIRAVPPVPPGSVEEPPRSVVVTAHEVDELVRVGDVPYQVNLDPQFAHRRGFPNALVPSVLLLTRVTSASSLPDRGIAEAWFHRPVPVGSVLECRLAEIEGTSRCQASVIGSPVPALTALVKSRS